MRFLIGVCLLHLVSCSSYEQDKQSNLYNPQMSKAGDKYVTSPMLEDPVAALIVGGVGLAANPEYYRSHALSGKCQVIPDIEAVINMPCQENVQVILKDAKGKELARSTPQGGEFAFKVNKDERYQLAVEAKGLMLTNTNLKALGIGDSVVVKLKKIRKNQK